MQELYAQSSQMECGTPKGQPKKETIAIGHACCVNVGKRADSSTYGGNVTPVTRARITTGYSYRRSKRK
eukprot:4486907-Heterocapsa_arctica.AAC.1